MVEVLVHSVRVSLITQNRVVVLMEVNGNRYLPIWIGADVADAIVLKMQEVELARPLTHDLLCSVIEALGAKISRVLVNDIHDNTFYARIIFDLAGRYVEVDSRPSDAIALAVRVNCPIFVEEVVLEQASLILDQPDVTMEGTVGELTVFRDFFDQMADEGEDEGGEDELDEEDGPEEGVL